MVIESYSTRVNRLAGQYDAFMSQHGDWARNMFPRASFFVVYKEPFSTDLCAIGAETLEFAHEIAEECKGIVYHRTFR
jgi:hypothetical protein